MDRTVVRKTTLADQDEALCLSLSLDERLRVIEELNRQGRVLAGYIAREPLNRKVVHVAYVDILGILESETSLPERTLETPYGPVKILPPELALVERILYAEQDAECTASARQMMASALADALFDWAEAERLAALPDFKVAEQLSALKREVARG